MPAIAEARKSILIVEDEMLVADDLTESLGQLGYAVTGYARDADEAIEKVEETKPDLVLMDINLGGERDGVAAAEAIRERWGIPVVFVTSYVTTGIVERAKAAGPYGFLTKPVSLRELDATLGIAVNQHETIQIEANQREELEQQIQETTIALGNTRQELQALSHHLISLQDDERRRIARELHDGLGQLTALVGIKLHGLEERVPAEFAPEVRSIRGDVGEIAEGLRDVSHRLYPSVIEDLGIAVALRALIEELRATGLRITGKIEPCSPLSKEVGTALYRITQEAARNSRKYGGGSPIIVRLWCESGNVNLSIRDRGPGFCLSEVRQRGGLGLVSMQERARLLGGTIMLSAAPGKGTTINVRIPIQERSSTT